MNTLHNIRSTPSVQPKYVNLFACTGPACEDNCCTGWSVYIDKKTFNAYRQTKVQGLTEQLEKNVKRARSLNKDTQYARIAMDPVTQECPLMAEKLCSIQSNLGEDKLSNTCATYPRNHRVMGGQHEQSLTLSCPEAARLALLQPDAMDFEETTVRVRVGVPGVLKPEHGLTLEVSSSIRVFALQLMRTEGLELWQKLAVLGVFCEKLTLTIESSEHAQIPKLLEEITHMATSGDALNALSDLRPDHDMQANIFSSLWKIKLSKQHSPVQEALHTAVIHGLGADPVTKEVTREKLIASYKTGIARLPEALEEAPFFLENYVINDMFSETFPFGEKTPQAHFLKLVTRLGLVRFMLAAQCTDGQNFPTPEQMARTIHVFCRQYQHDKNFAKSVNTALADSGWDTMEKIFRLIRT